MKLKDLGYFHTGGACQALYSPQSIEEIKAAFQKIREERCPFFYLGGGSNSLISDVHFPGAVISLHQMNHVVRRGDFLVCGAGALNNEVVRFAAKQQLVGFEWAYGLPGQIGATTRMNARCYGGEISQIAVLIKTCSSEGEVRAFSGGNDVFRGYKDTLFMKQRDLIYEVTLRLQPSTDSIQQIESRMQAFWDDRNQKQQFDKPSCGCIFKNDYELGLAAGFLLDLAGAKKLRVGAAYVNPKHANFVFHDQAPSQDILELSFQMQELVYQKFGVWLQYEMEFLGEFEQEQERIRAKKPHQIDPKMLEKLQAQFKARYKRS